jgi:N-acetylneuraminic acid mutarotase
MHTPAHSAPAATRWTQLAPLPDPIGFAGMLAGVLDNRLVVGGGSQWNKPVWQSGSRLLSDRIFVLDEPGGAWRVADSRLPRKCGHFATAATGGAIYLAGGIGEQGTLQEAHCMEAKAGGYSFARLPDLREGVVYASGAVCGGRFWVVGGLADPAAKQARRSVWSLSLDKPGAGWRREPDLPETGLFVPATAAVGEDLLVIGGMTFDAVGKLAPSRACHRLHNGAWTRLPDLPAPRVAASSPCPVLAGQRVLVAGGYAEVFGGPPREHPGFATETFVYDVGSATWSSGPALPSVPAGDRDAAGDAGPLPMVGATPAVWRDLVVIPGGEVRISTRTPAVLALRLPLAP